MTAQADPPPPRRLAIADALPSICFWGLVAVAAWAPLPFGSARPWASGLLALIVGLLVAALAVNDLVAADKDQPPLRPVILPLFLFSLTILWALIQCFPWVPASWQHPVWAEVAKRLPGQVIRPTITVNAAASHAAILHLVTYGAIFWLSYRFSQKAAKARSLMIAVACVAVIYSVWGLAVYWTGNGSVLWFKKWAYIPDLTSTFVNRNSYAAYNGIALIAMIGLFLEDILKRLDFMQSRRTIMRSLTELMTTHSAWIIGGIIITATALLLTHSRGGAGATGLGILALLLMASSVPSLRGPWRAWFGLAIVIGGLAALWLSGTVTLTRLANTSWDVEGRPEIYELTLQAIKNNPLLGTGLATFSSIFETYRTEDLPFFVNLAHNDYLENMLELGIPAALPLFAAAFLLAVRCASGAFERRRDAIIPCVAVGATALIASHSLIDFSMQIPAVATSYLILLGAGVAQAIPTQARGAARNSI